MNGKTLTAEQCSKLSLYILMTTKTREGEAEAWEKEKDAFLAAYIQKRRIFAIRADVEPQEISRKEALKMGALMQGMSDESPLRAIEAGK